MEAARLSLSALDAVRLTRAYLRDAPEALIYHSTLEYTYAGITQRNRNRLLSSYPGVDGVKTGFTSLAGHNLVASFAGDGRRLIAVVTGVPSRLDGAVMGTTRGQDYRDAVIARMLDWAREEFRTLRLLEAGEEIGRLPVYQGTSRSVVIGPAWPVVLTLALAEMDNIETSVDFESAYLVAPVEVGTRVGTLLVAASGTEVVKVDLVVAQAIPRGGFLRVVWDSLRLLFAPVVHRSLGQDRPTSGEP